MQSSSACGEVSLLMMVQMTDFSGLRRCSKRQVVTLRLKTVSKCCVHVPVDGIKTIHKLSLQPCFCYQQVQADLTTTTAKCTLQL